MCVSGHGGKVSYLGNRSMFQLKENATITSLKKQKILWPDSQSNIGFMVLS